MVVKWNFPLNEDSWSIQPHSAMPWVFGDNPVVKGVRQKLGKKVKEISSLYLFLIKSLQKRIHQFILSFFCNKYGAETTHTRKIHPENTFLGKSSSQSELWQPGEIWRNIKKDLWIMILVSKLGGASQLNKAAKFNFNVTCKVSGQGIYPTVG